MTEIGEPAPEIDLLDLDGNPHSLQMYRGKLVVLNFWSAECPWTARADKATAPLVGTWDDRVVVLSIASNANETRQEIAESAKARRVSPVLLDADQSAARVYGAQITPEIFVIDTRGILRYKGAFSDANFRNPELTQNYLEETVNALLASESPEKEHVPAYGCTIYFGDQHSGI
ncbi:MAG: redoxin domain-containing protein [Anaerolineales bacterium]|jgi:peroxiredoxin